MRMDFDKLDKKYYKIREVAEILGVSHSTLRYWEQEFPSCRPVRTPSNQRMYRPQDIETLRIIYYLLKIKGLKVETAKEQLRHNSRNISRQVEIVEKLQNVKKELKGLLKALNLRNISKEAEETQSL